MFSIYSENLNNNSCGLDNSTEIGNPQLRQQTCDTTVHVFVVTKESFETFCVT